VIALQVNLYPALENENYCHQNLLTTSQLKHTHMLCGGKKVNTTMIICIWVLNQAVSVVTLNGWRSIPDERWPQPQMNTQ